jgi:hypothetical protein
MVVMRRNNCRTWCSLAAHLTPAYCVPVPDFVCSYYTADTYISTFVYLHNTKHHYTNQPSCTVHTQCIFDGCTRLACKSASSLSWSGAPSLVRIICIYASLSLLLHYYITYILYAILLVADVITVLHYIIALLYRLSRLHRIS